MPENTLSRFMPLRLVRKFFFILWHFMKKDNLHCISTEPTTTQKSGHNGPTSTRRKHAVSALFICNRRLRPVQSRAAMPHVYFSGMFSRVFVSRVQNGSIDSMRQRSLVVCGERIVGPNDTTSSCGYLPRMIEHSSPA